MTVSELIETLRCFPDDMRVVLDGYEEGYDDLSPGQLLIRPIALNTGRAHWAGQHGEADDEPDGARPETVVDALVLRRTSNFC